MSNPTEMKAAVPKIMAGASIFRQLLTSLLATGILIALVGAGTMIFLETKSKKKDLELQFATSAATIEAYFQSVYVSPVNDALHFTERSDAFIDYLRAQKSELPEARALAERLLLYFTDRPSTIFLSARYIDAEGVEQIIVNGNKRSRKFSSFDNFPAEDILLEHTYKLFNQIKADKRGSVQYEGPFKYQDKYIFSAGIRKTDPEIGGFAGAIIFLCDLHDLSRYLESYAVSGKQLASLFSMEGQLLYGPDLQHPLIPHGTVSSEHNHAAKNSIAGRLPGAFGERSEACSRCPQSGSPSFFYRTSRILRVGSDEHPFLTLVLTMPSEIFYKQWREERYGAVLVIFILLLFVAAIAYRISIRFSRPLSELTIAANRIAAGDFVTQVRVPAKGELGLLIESFNNMAKLLSTARTKEEASLKEMRKLYQATEQSPATVVVTDITGAIEYVNPKFTEVTGYTAEEALGKNPRILKSGELSEETYKALWETILSGKVWRGEFHNKRKDGSLFWESASISAIRNESDKITHFLAVKEDITKHKLADKALLETTAQLQKNRDSLESILASAGDGIVGLDLEGKITFANTQALRFLGFSNEELLGKPSHPLWHHSRPDGTPYPDSECPNYITRLDGQDRTGEDYYWKKDEQAFLLRSKWSLSEKRERSAEASFPFSISPPVNKPKRLCFRAKNGCAASRIRRRMPF